MAIISVCGPLTKGVHVTKGRLAVSFSDAHNAPLHYTNNSHLTTTAAKTQQNSVKLSRTE